MREYALWIGRGLRGPITDVWNARGMQRALELLADVNREEGELRVRWVWLDGEVSPDFAPAAPVAALEDLDREAGSSFVVDDGGDGGDGARLVSYVLVDVPGGRRGALELSESMARRAARTTLAIQRVSILLGGLLVVSALTIIFLGVRLVGRPLAQLTAKAERVGAGDLSDPIELVGAGELVDLADSMNRMCAQLSEAQLRVARETADKIQALEQLRHVDRLQTVGRLASGIAHELGTPLNVVSGRAGLIESGKLGPGQVAESAEIIRTQAERMTHIIRQLLDFARRRTSEKQVLDIGKVVANTCELVAPAARKQGVVLETIEARRTHPRATKRRSSR
jgi:signal transduction histidine kinase